MHYIGMDCHITTLDFASEIALKSEMCSEHHIKRHRVHMGCKPSFRGR